jgi:uncharacterized phage protein (TIGR01671 family)
MREIKFRTAILLADKSFSRFHYWGFIKNVFISPISLNNKIKQSLNEQQFTGLTDKNGKDIYEGDICEVKGTKRQGTYMSQVIYYNQGFTLKDNYTYLNNDSCLLVGVTVIGNIHENPELIN